VTAGRVGITMGMRVVDGGVGRMAGGTDGKLEEAATMTERFGTFSEVSSDWTGFYKCLLRGELAEFSWLSCLLRILGIKLGFSNTGGGFGSGFDLV